MESVKNNTKDSIAILMATYNGARFISEQIESILSQSNQQWHLYIHDDGSTDGTGAIADEYAAIPSTSRRSTTELHESAGED